MNDPSSKAKLVRDELRRAASPDAADRARVRAKLHAALSAGLVSEAALRADKAMAAHGAASSGSSMVAQLTWAKATVTVLAIGAATGTTWLLHDSHGPREHGPRDSHGSASEAQQDAQTTQTPPAHHPLLEEPSHAQPSSTQRSAHDDASAFDVAPALAPHTDLEPNHGAPRAHRATLRAPDRNTHENGARTAHAHATSLDASTRAVERATSEPHTNASDTSEAGRAPVAATPHVSEELSLIRDANTALQKRDPALALRLLHDHAKRFPAGVLTQERRALRIIALCAQDPSAQTLAERDAFLRSVGPSPLSQRVAHACTPAAPRTAPKETP